MHSPNQYVAAYKTCLITDIPSFLLFYAKPNVSYFDHVTIIRWFFFYRIAETSKIVDEMLCSIHNKNKS